MADVKAPVLAESIPDATLLEWKKKPGDSVTANEVLVEVETDKVVLEVVAPESGVLAEIIRGDGETIVSGELIARIDTEAKAAAPAPQASAPEPAASAPQEAAAKPAAPVAASTGDLSPAVRRMVTEHNLDPSRITGTGRGGRLTKADVVDYMESQKQSAPAAAAPAPAAPPPAPAAKPAPSAPPSAAPSGERSERRVPMTRLRARIAERLLQAQQTAAILTTFNEVNMAPVMALRSRYKEQFEKSHGVRLGFMSFFAKAAVQALKRFPAVNAYIEGNEIVYHDYYDIGVAVGSPRGLVVPIVRDADRLNFAGIEQKIGEYGKAAQDGTLTIEDMTGGTFTISNGGVFGSLLSTPILNPPQSAILGMHKTQERPVAENGQVVIRPMMYLALSYDHRIVDGREAVQFLVTIKEAIEDPARMLLDL